MSNGYFKADPNLLIEHARKNKILLHFLRVLNVRGDYRFREEKRYTRIIRTLKVIARILAIVVLPEPSGPNRHINGKTINTYNSTPTIIKEN